MRENRNIRLLKIHKFLIGLIFWGPIGILYFQKVSGSFTLGMSIFSISVISTAIFEVPTGVLSDRVGRKRTLILGSFCFVLAYLFYAIGTSYLVLVIGSICTGIGRAFYSGNNKALLYDTLKEGGREDQYDHYIGRTNSGMHLALGASAIIGSFVASYSFKAVMWLSLIPRVINLVTAFFFLEPSIVTTKIEINTFGHIKESFRHFRRNKRLRVLTIASAIKKGLGESSFQFRGAFIEQLWPIWAIGFPNVLSSFFASVSLFYSGSIIKKFGDKLVLIGGGLYSVIVNFIAYAFPSVISPALITTTSFSFGAGISARSKLFQREFTDEQRATMDSMKSLLSYLLIGLVSMLIGFVADLIGPSKTLILANVMTLIPLYMYKVFFRTEQKIRYS